MSGFRPQLDPKTTFSQNPSITLFSRKLPRDDKYLAQTFEVPFDTIPTFGESSRCTIPPKTEAIRRITVRSTLPELYTPLGPGYVYPLYSDQVDGGVYVDPDALAIQPGDFVGYFNTQNLNYWATNFTGYTISVAYDSDLTKFVFTSGTYSNIFFKNEGSASFWGFDIRTFDFITPEGYWGYNITDGTLTAPLTLVQAGWIRGYTPPPPTGFSYVDSVATKLIKEARLLIGGQTIDRLTSERLYLEQDLGLAYENQAGLTILEGKNDTGGVYSPREYYTKLTFNLADTLNIGQLERHDVKVEVDFEKFENLPSSLITTGGFFDVNSWRFFNSGVTFGTKQYIDNVLYDPWFDSSWALVYKNYLIIGPMPATGVPSGGVVFYNQDTGTSYIWAPSNASAGYGKKPFVIGNTIYTINGGYLLRADISTILSNPSTLWTGSTYSYFEGTPEVPFGEGKNYIIYLESDARYVYTVYNCNYYTIADYRTALLSGSLAGDNHTWTHNIIVYDVTPPLSASANAAFEAFFATYAPGFTTFSNTQSIYNTTNTLYTRTSYYTAVQTPGNRYIPALDFWNNNVMIRYDSTGGFNSSNSYTFPLLSSGNPASIKDIFPGVFDVVSIPNSNYLINMSFDGRYLYYVITNPLNLIRIDTQNFTSTSSFTRVASGTTVSPWPLTKGGWLNKWVSDGRYTYTGGIFDSGNWKFIRYDSTKDVFSQDAWEYRTDSTFSYNYAYEIPLVAGFDGKYVYYQIANGGGARSSAIFYYDTTKPFGSSSSWGWLDISTSGVVQTSIGTTFTFSPFVPFGGVKFLTGTRYIYLVNLDGRGYPNIAQNFIIFDPLTMTQSLDASVLVKYEKYDTPRKFTKSLLGQTDLNEFTIRSGQVSGNFQLEFSGPVRELWISPDVPALVSRVTIRINNEILIDDDRPVAGVVRAYESHSNMPTGNLYMYNFSFNPEEMVPSGTLNFSRVPYPMIEIKLTSPAVVDTKIRIYSKNFNVFETRAGLGGLAFSSTT